MPVADEGQRIVRRAKTVRGELRFRMLCDPRFDYGRGDHEVRLDTRRGALQFPAKGRSGRCGCAPTCPWCTATAL